VSRRAEWLDDRELKILDPMELVTDSAVYEGIDGLWEPGANLIYDPVTDRVYTAGRDGDKSAVEVVNETLAQFQPEEL
jgi:hypothetical protein